MLFVLFPAGAFVAGSSAGYEQGGPYARFEPVVQQYDKSGELFRVDGHCQSACTLFLGIRNACIGPQANFLFHAPHDDQRRPSEYYLKRFLPHYNAKLSAFLLANHALEKGKHPVKSGEDRARVSRNSSGVIDLPGAGAPIPWQQFVEPLHRMFGDAFG